MLKRLISAAVLVLIVVACSWALLSPQFFRVHDFTHAGRIAEMSRALSDGHFPVRWSQNFGYGYGMPLFEFYGPLPFYIGGALFLLGLNVVLVIKLLYLFANIATALGGYFLGRKFFGTSGGLIAAALLALAPYRALNLFVRGALNETWAIAFLPWIMLGLVKVFRRERRGWIVLVVSLTGLLLSHNVMTLLFAPLLVLFSALYFAGLMWRRVPELFRNNRFRWRNFTRMMGQLVGSVLLSVGLSAFYVVPAFVEKGLTQVEQTVLDAYFNYRLHFLYIRQLFTPGWGFGGSSWGVKDDISFFLGWGQWFALGVLALVGVITLVRSWRRKELGVSRRVLAIVVPTAALLGVSLFMSLLKSQWLWEKLPLLEYAQFPWRWLGGSVVFLALLAASVGSLLRLKLSRTIATTSIVLIAVIGSAGLFRPERYLDTAEEYYYTDASRIRTNLSSILMDYLPQGVPNPPAVIPEGLFVNESALPAEKWEVLADRTHEKLIKTSFDQETLVSFAVAEYPGWRTEIDGQRWSRQVGSDGNIELLVPPGERLVTLRFLSTPVRMYADIVSAVAGLALIALLLPVHRKNA